MHSTAPLGSPPRVLSKVGQLAVLSVLCGMQNNAKMQALTLTSYATPEHIQIMYSVCHSGIYYITMYITSRSNTQASNQEKKQHMTTHFFGGCYVSAHNYREYLENGKSGGGLPQLDNSFLKM